MKPSNLEVFVRRSLVVLLACGLMPAWANYSCTGPVKGVAIDVSVGDVLAETAGGMNWPRLCNTRNQVNGVAPDDCKRVYASLLAAQAQGRTVTIWISDASSTANCGSQTPWGWVAGFYFFRVDN